MPNSTRIETNSAMLGLTADFETFDGACDPAFDNDLDVGSPGTELEFAL